MIGIKGVVIVRLVTGHTGVGCVDIPSLVAIDALDVCMRTCKLETRSGMIECRRLPGVDGMASQTIVIELIADVIGIDG